MASWPGLTVILSVPFFSKQESNMALMTSWTENTSLIRMKLYLCFDKCPLVLCYAFKLCKHYNSFQSFFHTILYRFTVQNFVLCKFTYSCHLVFPCKSWLCIWLVNWNLKEFSFSVIIIDWLKNVPFFLNLVPRTPENAS